MKKKKNKIFKYYKIINGLINIHRYYFSKAEIALYEGKLRINGKVPVKKGVQIAIDDVIDFVQGPCPKNENFLLVTRVTILNAKLDEDVYKVKMLREKSLTIEQYDDSWRSASDDS